MDGCDCEHGTFGAVTTFMNTYLDGEGAFLWRKVIQRSTQLERQYR